MMSSVAKAQHTCFYTIIFLSNVSIFFIRNVEFSHILNSIIRCNIRCSGQGGRGVQNELNGIMNFTAKIAYMHFKYNLSTYLANSFLKSVSVSKTFKASTRQFNSFRKRWGFTFQEMRSLRCHIIEQFPMRRTWQLRKNNVHVIFQLFFINGVCHLRQKTLTFCQ